MISTELQLVFRKIDDAVVKRFEVCGFRRKLQEAIFRYKTNFFGPRRHNPTLTLVNNTILPMKFYDNIILQYLENRIIGTGKNLLSGWSNGAPKVSVDNWKELSVVR